MNLLIWTAQQKALGFEVRSAKYIMGYQDGSLSH
jgi:hypothetical protein